MALNPDENVVAAKTVAKPVRGGRFDGPVRGGPEENRPFQPNPTKPSDCATCHTFSSPWLSGVCGTAKPSIRGHASDRGEDRSTLALRALRCRESARERG